MLKSLEEDCGESPCACRTSSSCPCSLAGFGTAEAQYRCDCTSVVDTCNAEVVARGSFLEIKTNQQQCARVDYFVDGQPFVSVVVDGEDRQNWLARTTNPRILVQSCQVCRDTGASPAAAAPPRATPPPAAENQGATNGDNGLEPLIAERPRVSRSGARARPARLRRGRVHGHARGHRREPARRHSRAAQRLRRRGPRRRRAPPLSRGRRARAAGRHGAHRVRAGRPRRRPPPSARATAR